MLCVKGEEETILVVAEKGIGKRSKVGDYRITNRGGKGVKTINITNKTGQLIAIKNVVDTDDLMIINKSGILIRLPVSGLRVMGRATQGVKLINLKEKDSIAAVTNVPKEEEEDGATTESDTSISDDDTNTAKGSNHEPGENGTEETS